MIVATGPAPVNLLFIANGGMDLHALLLVLAPLNERLLQKIASYVT